MARRRRRPGPRPTPETLRAAHRAMRRLTEGDGKAALSPDQAAAILAHRLPPEKVR